MTSRALAMPGQQNGMPERAMHHDLMHVITGFDTDARGEGRLSAFYAGATDKHRVEGADPFTFVVVGLMTFHLGYKVGPTFVGAEVGVSDPLELMALLDVGSAVPLAFMTEWKFADDFATPLTEVRRRFGLSPSGALATAFPERQVG
jgi:hypothetical protein